MFALVKRFTKLKTYIKDKNIINEFNFLHGLFWLNIYYSIL